MSFSNQAMNYRRTIIAAVLLFFIMPLKQFAQQPKQIKVSEFSISNIKTIEERVFMVHTIHEKGYYCYKSPSTSNTIDVYVANDASDELSDFDFFYDHLLLDQLNEFSYLDKATRGELFVQWRQEIDDEIFRLLYEDFTRGLAAENATCETALPFCTNAGLYQFPAGVNSGSPCGNTYSASCSDPYYCSGYHQGQDNCLSTAPNPAFYYMRIDEPGNLNIYMYTTPSKDLDFDCWGPFSDISTACDQLSCSTMVDCSYDPAHTEHCHINNAQHGDYYILLITNFSNDTCNISFENIGTGTTDCSILPPLVSGGGPYCVGETIQLTAQNQIGATFSWTGPNGFTSNQQNPTLPNCTMEMAGVYTCTITVGDESSSAETEYIVVVPQPTADFTFDTVCEGNPVQFTSTSTTNPSGEQITNYEWNFGDDQTDSSQNVSHMYSQAGNYEVTLFVSTGNGTCTDQITKTVTINPQPTASFDFTSVCRGNPTQFTSTSSGQQITSYQWNFGDGQTGSGQSVSHTYAQAGDYQVTHTVQAADGACSDQNTQTVTVYTSPDATITAQPNTVIYGGTATLTANPGAQGNFIFHWEPANMVINADAQTTQTVELEASQTYTVTITNPQGDCTSSAQVTVVMEGSNMTALIAADQTSLCDGDSTTLHAIPSSGTGNYTYSWSPANTLNNPESQNPVATPLLGSTTYTCHVNDGITSQDISITITVHPIEETNVFQTICESETYNFFGQGINTPGVYHHTLQTQYDCDSVIYLYLTVNNNDTTYFTLTDEENCDSYYWDPKGHEIIYTDHPDMVYNQTGTYQRIYLNQNGCDSLVTMSAQFEYTPTPNDIYPKDPENTAPHWVITATEFQINSYDYYLWDTNPYCQWDTVLWTCDEAPNWILEPFGAKGKSCKIYVLNQVEDTVWLKAHAFNRCAPETGIEQKYWLVCSFYGIEEPSGKPADFTVVPNPNNGQMTLNFENLTGKIDIKVYNMEGSLIDHFQTYNNNDFASCTYNMKNEADGIYFIVATAKEGIASKKVIIQN